MCMVLCCIGMMKLFIGFGRWFSMWVSGVRFVVLFCCSIVLLVWLNRMVCWFW